MQHMTAAQAAANEAMNATQTPAEQAAWATQHLADANAEAAREARNLYAAQRMLAGGLLGVEGASLSAAQSQQDLKEANAEVNRLAAEGKKGTQEYRDALMEQDQAALDAVNSQAALVQSVQDYIEANGHSKAATADAVDMIRQFASQAGLTGAQTRELISDTLGLVDTYGRIPGSVYTDIRNNAGDNMDALVRYWQQLQAIPTHKDVFIVTHYSSVGTPGTAGGPQ
jgi:hypothetical protein